jgi:hypothetical protein
VSDDYKGLNAELPGHRFTRINTNSENAERPEITLFTLFELDALRAEHDEA